MTIFKKSYIKNLAHVAGVYSLNNNVYNYMYNVIKDKTVEILKYSMVHFNGKMIKEEDVEHALNQVTLDMDYDYKDINKTFMKVSDVLPKHQKGDNKRPRGDKLREEIKILTKNSNNILVFPESTFNDFLRYSLGLINKEDIKISSNAKILLRIAVERWAIRLLQNSYKITVSRMRERMIDMDIDVAINIMSQCNVFIG